MKPEIVQRYDDSSSQRGTDVLTQNATPYWSGINVHMVTYRPPLQRLGNSIANPAANSFLNYIAESSTNPLQRKEGSKISEASKI